MSNYGFSTNVLFSDIFKKRMAENVEEIEVSLQNLSIEGEWSHLYFFSCMYFLKYAYISVFPRNVVYFVYVFSHFEYTVYCVLD